MGITDIMFDNEHFIEQRYLKLGDIFTREGNDFEVYLTISIDGTFYFVRLSDAEVFDSTIFPMNSKVQRHLCTLTVEM